MTNAYMDEFMAAAKFEALTFNDVSLETQYADFLPDQAEIGSNFSRNIRLNAPFVSAAMDTVTESRMAIAMAMAGGIGVIHKNMTPERQADEVQRVKHFLHGLIKKPVCFRQGMKISEVLAEKAAKNYQFTGFPILDEQGHVLGMLSSRDIKFLADTDIPVESAMTPLERLVTATSRTTLTQAYDIMVKNRVGKLPIVDTKGCLKGLYSFSDVASIIRKIQPTFNRDSRHRLRVAAAISPYDEARSELLVQAEVDALVIDTSHGHSKGVLETVAMMKAKYPQVDVVAGNIGTAEAAEALLKAGADAVKVGIGPGSICTTRVVAGVGVPQITAVYRAYKAVKGRIPVIADGGINYSGDVAKAIAAGASSVMMGSVLAGTDESPGETVLHQGRRYVSYRGMGSMDAMKAGKGSRERYSQGNVADLNKLVPQGIEAIIPYKGTVIDVLHQYAGGLRFSLGYCGARTIAELQRKARFVRVTAAGVQEAHPHAVKIIKDAPNYSANS